MKTIKLLGLALALAISAATQAQNEIRKEVNVEVENGEHVMTITTTDKDGKTTTETFRGKEAKEKMHEMHRNVPEGAEIEREMVEEIIDEEGNVMVIRKTHSGEKGDMHWKHKSNMSEEEREAFHAKMKEFHEGLSEEERKMLHHHMMRKHHEMSEEERHHMHQRMMEMEAGDIDVEVDEENNKMIIRMGDDVEEIDLDEMKGAKDGHRMIFITEEDNGDGQVVEKRIVVITRNVRIEEDEDLQNDLKGVNFKAFPNPNKGNFNIEVKLDGKTPTYFVLTDMSGKEYYKGEIKVEKKGIYTQPVKMEDMPKGTYLIQVTQGEKAATKRVVVE